MCLFSTSTSSHATSRSCFTRITVVLQIFGVVLVCVRYFRWSMVLPKWEKYIEWSRQHPRTTKFKPETERFVIALSVIFRELFWRASLVDSKSAWLVTGNGEVNWVFRSKWSISNFTNPQPLLECNLVMCPGWDMYMLIIFVKVGNFSRHFCSPTSHSSEKNLRIQHWKKNPLTLSKILKWRDYRPRKTTSLLTDMHSPLDTITHILGICAHRVHRRTCIQHTSICIYFFLVCVYTK